ncbi:MAG: hypothetical protein IT442_07505 [Phycisphaeraceae bacterium]|nr:hypothetical protein [Phycisphaeraceae bacterium]
MSAPTLPPQFDSGRPLAPPQNGMVRLVCPLCGKRYKVSRQLVGRVGECVHCTGRFVIPRGLPPVVEGSAHPAAVGISLADGRWPGDHHRPLSDYLTPSELEHASVHLPPSSGHRWQRGVSIVGHHLARRPVTAALGSLTLVVLAAFAFHPQLVRNFTDPKWWGVTQDGPGSFSPPPIHSLAIENNYPAASRVGRDAATEPSALVTQLIDDSQLPDHTYASFPPTSPASDTDDEITSLIASTGRPVSAQTLASTGAPDGQPDPARSTLFPAAPDARQSSPKSPGLVYWAPASDPVELDNIRIRLLSVHVGQVPLQHIVDGMVSQSPGSYLSVEIEVTNLDPNASIDYVTWAGSELSLGSDMADLRDDHDQPLQRVVFTAAVTPRGRHDQWTIGPNLAMIDVLVFRPPQGDPAYLRLELPGRNVGLNVPVRFQIPVSFIQH